MKKTLENLGKAFLGESQARNRYSFYAKIALKEGYEQISEIFLKTAENEKEHAKWLFRLINELKVLNSSDGRVKEENFEKLVVEAEVPMVLGTTIENLKAAIEGEHYENTEMYPEFADMAEEECFPEIAKRLRAIAIAEEHHEETYIRLLDNIENKKVFQRDEEKNWVCRKCGYRHTGKEAPEKCPSCDHEQKYFELDSYICNI